MNKKSLFLTGLLVLLFGFVFAFKFGGFAANLSGIRAGDAWFMPLVLISSLIDSINPCAFSVLLITIAFFMSMGSTRSAVLKAGGAYIAGIYVVYLLIGLGMLQVLHFFGVPHFMARVGATLVILLGGLGLISDLFPSFPIKFKIPELAHGRIATLMNKASVPALFLLGGLVAICEFPCTGGPYLMILGLLHDSATYLSGLGYLVIYNIVFVLPLVIILLIASEEGLLEKVKAWKKAETGSAKLWASVAMIAIGVIIFLL